MDEPMDETMDETMDPFDQLVEQIRNAPNFLAELNADISDSSLSSALSISSVSVTDSDNGNDSDNDSDNGNDSDNDSDNGNDAPDRNSSSTGSVGASNNNGRNTGNTTVTSNVTAGEDTFPYPESESMPVAPSGPGEPSRMREGPPRSRDQLDQFSAEAVLRIGEDLDPTPPPSPSGETEGVPVEEFLRLRGPNGPYSVYIRQQPAAEQEQPERDANRARRDDISLRRSRGALDLTRIDINRFPNLATNEVVRQELRNIGRNDKEKKDKIRKHTKLFNYEAPVQKRGQPKIQNDDQCLICMNAFFNNQRARRLKCFHMFHNNCLFRWLKNENTCPSCRVRYDVDEKDGENNGDGNDNAGGNGDQPTSPPPSNRAEGGGDQPTSPPGNRAEGDGDQPTSPPGNRAEGDGDQPTSPPPSNRAEGDGDQPTSPPSNQNNNARRGIMDDEMRTRYNNSIEHFLNEYAANGQRFFNGSMTSGGLTFRSEQRNGVTVIRCSRAIGSIRDRRSRNQDV